MEEYIVHSLKETTDVAKRIVDTLKGGELILAKGDLGVGKTALLQEIGKLLHVERIINSPTFNLVKIYDGKLHDNKLTIYHVDCYRLEGVDEKRKDLGLDEVIGEDNTLVYIEWPEYADEFSKNYSPRMEIEISYISENERRIVINEK